ncbi:MAG: AMP-binding protein [Shimia sp.]
MTLHQALAAGFAGRPDAVALDTPDGPVTHGALEALADALAGHVARHARPGDRLVAQVEKTWQGLALFLGCLRAGVIFVPLNPAYGRDELAILVADADPAIVVHDPSAPLAQCGGAAVHLTLDARGRGSLIDGAAGGPPSRSPPAGDDVAAILYTSGTTGRPKGAMLTHENLRSNIAALVDLWRIGPGDTLLHVLPVFHTHGLFVAAGPALMGGARMLWHPRFEVAAALSALPDATVMMGVPTHYGRLLAEPDLASATRGLRLFVSGSAPLGADIWEAFRTATGHAILERYGMTETTMIASNPLDGPRVPGTVGHALPGVELRIVPEEADASSVPMGRDGTRAARSSGNLPVASDGVTGGEFGTPGEGSGRGETDGKAGGASGLPPGSDDMPPSAVDAGPASPTVGAAASDVVGEVRVRGPNVLRGYWRAPDATAAAFDADGWFRTGDLGRIAPDGRLTLLGRSRDLVISGGLNVYPPEVEAVCNSLPGIAECAVIGVPHPDLGEAVACVYVGRAAPDEVISALRARLAGFKRPKRAIAVDALPRNAMGKVEKARLRARFADLFVGAG